MTRSSRQLQSDVCRTSCDLKVTRQMAHHNELITFPSNSLVVILQNSHGTSYIYPVYAPFDEFNEWFLFISLLFRGAIFRAFLSWVFAKSLSNHRMGFRWTYLFNLRLLLYVPRSCKASFSVRPWHLGYHQHLTNVLRFCGSEIQQSAYCRCIY